MTQIYHQSYSFTMVEENFEYWPSELSKMNQFYHRVYHFFTIMVDENFEIWHIIFFSVYRIEIWDLWDIFNQIWDRIWDLWELWDLWDLWAVWAACIREKLGKTYFFLDSLVVLTRWVLVKPLYFKIRNVGHTYSWAGSFLGGSQTTEVYIRTREMLPNRLVGQIFHVWKWQRTFMNFRAHFLG